MPEGLGPRLTARLTLLVAAVRAGGVRVGVGELLAAHRALAAVDASDRAASYFALRATLCSRHEDLAAFDAAFAEWFGGPLPAAARRPRRCWTRWRRSRFRAWPCRARSCRRRAAAELELVPAAWSDVELLRDKDFAEYSEEERRRARRVMWRLAASAPTRPSRRTRPARRRGAPPHAARPDLRRTLRASLRTQGDPLERHWREPGSRPRPLVLVCDVSGSMEPYARMLLAYMQACVAARRRVEAFVFGTRLTRVTAELRGRDPDRALARAAQAATRLVGRHADRRRAGHAEPRARPAPGPRSDRGAALRRLGSRRAGAARARDGPPGALRPPAGLAQPAQGPSRLRAAHPRHAGGAAARGQLPGRKLAWRRSRSWPKRSGASRAMLRIALRGEGCPERRRAWTRDRRDGSGRRPRKPLRSGEAAGRPRRAPIVGVLAGRDDRRARRASGAWCWARVPRTCSPG